MDDLPAQTALLPSGLQPGLLVQGPPGAGALHPGALRPLLRRLAHRPKALPLRRTHGTCSLAATFPRPDLFLVLDVPVEKLLARKQEVAPEELRRQREAYRRFALETPNAFLLDGALPLEEVAKYAIELVLSHLEQRIRVRIE